MLVCLPKAEKQASVTHLLQRRYSTFLLMTRNPKWFVEVHPFGVRFHKPQNIQMITAIRLIFVFK